MAVVVAAVGSVDGSAFPQSNGSVGIAAPSDLDLTVGRCASGGTGRPHLVARDCSCGVVLRRTTAHDGRFVYALPRACALRSFSPVHLLGAEWAPIVKVFQAHADKQSVSAVTSRFFLFFSGRSDQRKRVYGLHTDGVVAAQRIALPQVSTSRSQRVAGAGKRSSARDHSFSSGNFIHLLRLAVELAPWQRH